MMSNSRRVQDIQANEVSITLKIWEATWENIRHNEKSRNNMLTLYLAIVGAFFGFAGRQTPEDDVGLVVFFIGILVWLIGIAFSITNHRFISMIKRDNQIAAHALSILEHHQAAIAEFRVIHMEYANRVRNRVRWTVTTTIQMTTLLVSASAGALGASRLLSSGNPWLLLGMMAPFVVANVACFVLFGRWMSRLAEPARSSQASDASS